MDNKELFQYIYNTFSDYLGIIFFSRDINNPESVFNNGTVSFVNTGKKQILVTCLHVYEEFLKQKRIKKNILLGIAGKSNTCPLNITNAKILSKGNKSIDLITMELPEDLNLSKIGCKYFNSFKWPPERVEKNDVTVLIGFLGKQRYTSYRGLETPPIPIVKVVSSVSERNFILATEDDETITVKFDKTLPDIDSLGGLSGSAVFRSIEDKKKCGFSLAGFVYNSLNLDIMCHHANLINENGNISKDIIFDN